MDKVVNRLFFVFLFCFFVFVSCNNASGDVPASLGGDDDGCGQGCDLPLAPDSSPDSRKVVSGVRSRLLFLLMTDDAGSDKPYKLSQNECDERIRETCRDFGICSGRQDVAVEFIERVDSMCGSFFDNCEISSSSGKKIDIGVYAYRLKYDGKEGFVLVTDDLRLGDVLYFCADGIWEEQREMISGNIKLIVDGGIASMAEIWNGLKMDDLKKEFPFVAGDSFKTGNILGKGVPCAIMDVDYGDWTWESAVAPSDGKSFQELVADANSAAEIKKCYLKVPEWNQQGIFNDVFCLLHAQDIASGVPMSGMEMVCADSIGNEVEYADTSWKLHVDQHVGCVVTAFAQVLAYLGADGRNDFEKFDVSLLDIMAANNFHGEYTSGGNINAGNAYLDYVGLEKNDGKWCWKDTHAEWDGSWDWQLMSKVSGPNWKGQTMRSTLLTPETRKASFMVSCFIATLLEYQKGSMQFFSGGTSAGGNMFFDEDIHGGYYEENPKPGILLKNGFSSDFVKGSFNYSKLTGVDTHLFYNSIKNGSPVVVGDTDHEYLFDGCIIKTRNKKLTAVTYDKETGRASTHEKEDSEEIRYCHVNYGWGGTDNGWLRVPCDAEYRIDAFLNLRQTSTEKMVYNPPVPVVVDGVADREVTVYNINGSAVRTDIKSNIIALDTKASFNYEPNDSDKDDLKLRNSENRNSNAYQDRFGRNLFFVFSNPTAYKLELPTIEVVGYSADRNEIMNGVREVSGNGLPVKTPNPAPMEDKSLEWDVSKLSDFEKKKFEESCFNFEIGELYNPVKTSNKNVNYRIIHKVTAGTAFGPKTLYLALDEHLVESDYFTDESKQAIGDYFLKEGPMNDVYDLETSVFCQDWSLDAFRKTMYSDFPFTGEIIVLYGHESTAFHGSVSGGLTEVYHIVSDGNKVSPAQSIINIAHEFQHALMYLNVDLVKGLDSNTFISELFSQIAEETVNDFVCKNNSLGYIANNLGTDCTVTKYEDRVGKLLQQAGGGPGDPWLIVRNVGSIIVQGMKVFSSSLDVWSSGAPAALYGFGYLLATYIIRNYGLDVIHDFLGKVDRYNSNGTVKFKNFQDYLKDRFYPSTGFGEADLLQAFAVTGLLSGYSPESYDDATGQTFNADKLKGQGKNYEFDFPFKYNCADYTSDPAAANFQPGFKTLNLPLTSNVRNFSGMDSVDIRVASVNLDNYTNDSFSSVKNGGLYTVAAESATEIAPHSNMIVKVVCPAEMTQGGVYADINWKWGRGCFNCNSRYVKLRLNGKLDSRVKVSIVSRMRPYGLAGSSY